MQIDERLLWRRVGVLEARIGDRERELNRLKRKHGTLRSAIIAEIVALGRDQRAALLRIFELRRAREVAEAARA